MYKQDLDTNPTVFSVTPIDDILHRCNQCNTCKMECSFLQSHGNPKEIAFKIKTKTGETESIAFQCSLCGLCKSVCPNALDPSAMFLSLRENDIKSQGGLSKKAHKRLIKYENIGLSKKFTFRSLPKGCNTVFFPGCSLPGIRPETTLSTYAYLQNHITNVGIVLDCCTKISHDLGRTDYFLSKFNQLKLYLLENQIQTIIVTCPSCHSIFTTYGKEFRVKTVYEIMAEKGLRKAVPLLNEVAIHDPCQIRFQPEIHAAARSLVQACGVKVKDTAHHGEKTFCCGEGGGAGCISPKLADQWTIKRVNESGQAPVATYCAGCVTRISAKTQTFHLLDLVFDTEKTLIGKAAASRAPFTFLNRIRLKNKFKKQPAINKSERSGSKKEKNKVYSFAALIFATAFISAVGYQLGKLF